MNYNTLVLIVIAIFAGVVLAALAKECRQAFQVPEGYAGLLYHKGKFAKVLRAGPHVRWGRHFTAAFRESNPALLNLRLMQSLSAAQMAGNTLVLGVPGCVPLEHGLAGSPEHKPEDGAS